MVEVTTTGRFFEPRYVDAKRPKLKRNWFEWLLRNTLIGRIGSEAACGVTRQESSGDKQPVAALNFAVGCCKISLVRVEQVKLTCGRLQLFFGTVDHYPKRSYLVNCFSIRPN